MKLPLSDDLYDKIKTDILSEDLMQGTKLTEQSVCDKYEVSRTPVREAFKQLEREGLIETIPNKGAYIVGFARGDLKDLFTLREVLERQAVAWAIERIYEDEMSRLEESFEFMEFYTLKSDANRMAEINNNFHKIIYKASHNRMLEASLLSFNVYIKASKHTKPFNRINLDTIFEEHRAIFDAFKSKDPQAGDEAARIHILNAKRRALGN